MLLLFRTTPTGRWIDRGRQWSCLLFVAVTAVLACGCRNLHRRQEDQAVVARQLSLRGMQALEQCRWSDARRLFARAIEASPSDERAHFGYAHSLCKTGEPTKAVAHMEESVRLSARDPERLVELGQIYWEQGQAGQARQRVDDAIRANPQLASAHALRGQLLYESGQLDAALASLHRALTLRPNYPEVQLTVAEIHRRRDEPHRALATLAAVADNYPPNEVPSRVLFLEGLVFHQLGRLAESLGRFEAVAKLEPNNPANWYQLAATKSQLGRAEAARVDVVRALELSPSDAASLQLLAQLEQTRAHLASERPPLRN